MIIKDGRSLNGQRNQRSAQTDSSRKGNQKQKTQKKENVQTFYSYSGVHSFDFNNYKSSILSFLTPEVLDNITVETDLTSFR